MEVTTKEACEFFEVDRSTLTRWRDAGAQDAHKGRDSWDLRKLVEFWADNIFTGGSRECADESLVEARRRYWLAKAEREELTVLKEKKDLIPKADIVPLWAKRLGVLVSGLENLRFRLPAMLQGKQDLLEMREIVKKEIRALRGAYATTGIYCPDVPPDQIFEHTVRALRDALGIPEEKPARAKTKKQTTKPKRKAPSKTAKKK